MTESPAPAEAIRVSVIIPAYNAELTLGEQLDALANQIDAPPFEVLVSDNGSSDQTRRVAEQRDGSVPHLRVIDASGVAGPAAARNIAARLARGDALLFCDADDVVGDSWVAELTDALTTDDLAGGGFEHKLLNSEGATVSWDVSERIRLEFWPEFAATPTSNLGVRRGVFESLGGFDELLTIAEDIDFCWRAQLAGHTLGHRSTAIVHLRKRAGLRAVFRQARSYGTGGRILEHRYSQIAAAYRAPTPAVAPDGATEPSPDAGSRAKRIASRTAAVRRVGDLADPTWRLGEWWGKRIARPHTDVLADPRGDRN